MTNISRLRQQKDFQSNWRSADSQIFSQLLQKELKFVIIFLRSIVLESIYDLKSRFYSLYHLCTSRRYRCRSLFTLYRDTIMAAAANSANKKRTRPRGLVPADVSRHHRPKTADRNGRHQRRPLQIRQARQIGHQIKIGPGLAVQLASASFEGLNCTNYHQTIAFGSCKSL